MRARRHGSLRRLSMLSIAAALAVLVGVLGQVPASVPAGAAPLADRSGGADPVEVVESRTRSSATFRRPDGSMVTRVSAAPMHFRRGGEWERIDHRLQERPDGSVGTVATGYDLALPDDLTQPVSVEKAGAGVSFALRDAEAGERSVDGTRATYADVLAGVDVDYTTGPDMVKEELVLEGPAAERSFAFDLDPAGAATPRLAADGGVDLVEPDGSVGARIAPPVMADAAGASSTDLAYELRRGADGGWVLGLDADTGWLRSGDRSWPVRVDPTVSFAGLRDTFLSDPRGATEWSEGQQSRILVTSQGSSRVRRGVVAFGPLEHIPASAVVLDGTVGLWSTGNGSANTSVSVHRLSQPFTTAATWTKRDGTATWSTPGGAFAAGAEDTQVIDGSTAGYRRFSIGQLAQDWVNGTAQTHGLMVKMTNEQTGPSTTLQAEFASSTSANVPYLDVLWEEAIGSRSNWTFDEVSLSDRSSLSVNVASGDLVYTGNDVDVAGVGGMDLTVDRVYSGRSYQDQAGLSWQLGFGRETRISTFDSGKTRILRGPDHAAWRFAKAGSGWTAPSAINATMSDESAGVRVLFHRTGETWFFSNASGHRLVWRENKNGHRIAYAYNASGQLTSITDTHGRAYTVAYTGGRPTRITDASYPGGARTWQYSYAPSGSLTSLASFTDADGKTTSYGYDHDTADLTRITDSRGNKVKLTYSYAIDPSGGYPRVTSIQRMTNDDWDSPVGPKWTYTYDLAAKTTTVTTPNGNVAGATAAEHQTTYHWDETTLEVEHVRNRLGQFEQTDRSDNGDVTQFTSQGSGPAGGTGTGTGTAAVSDITYDGNDNPTKSEAPGISDASGAARETSRTTYYGPNEMHGGQAASPATGQYRPKQATDEQGNTTDFSYDAAGNLTRSAQGPAVSANLAYTTAADAPVPKGLLKTATDGKGQTTHYTHNTAGDLTSVKPPLVNGVHPGEFTYTYEPGTNRRATQRDAAGTTLTYTYDRSDRVTRIANSNGQRVDYAYDTNGNLTSRLWTPATAGANATYVYDRLNRRTSETIAGVTTTYTYDDNGNMRTMVDGGGTTTYRYDRLDRVDRITPPVGGAIAAAYDDTATERTRTWIYPGGQRQRTNYALSGKVLGVTALNSSGNVIRSLTYDYKGPAAGSETFLRRSETQRSGSTVDRTYTYAYDHNNRLCWATTRTTAPGPFTIGACPTAAGAPSGAGVTTWSYQWDAASNRTRITHLDNGTIGRNETDSHDAANRLVGHDHDSRGNLLRGNHTVDAWNRQSGLEGITLGYGTPDNTELVTDGNTGVPPVEWTRFG